jgi:hypothetical protein
MVDQEIETNLNEVVSKNEEKDFDKIFWIKLSNTAGENLGALSPIWSSFDFK